MENLNEEFLNGMDEDALQALLGHISKVRGESFLTHLKTNSEAKALSETANQKRRGRPRISTFLDNGNLEPWIHAFGAIVGLEDESATAADVAQWMDNDLRSKGKVNSTGSYFFADNDGFQHEIRIVVKSMTVAAESTRAKAVKAVIEASPEQADAVALEKRAGVEKAAGVLDDGLKDSFMSEYERQVSERKAEAAAATVPPPPVA